MAQESCVWNPRTSSYRIIGACCSSGATAQCPRSATRWYLTCPLSSRRQKGAQQRFKVLRIVTHTPISTAGERDNTEEEPPFGQRRLDTLSHSSGLKLCWYFAHAPYVGLWRRARFGSVGSCFFSWKLVESDSAQHGCMVQFG